MADVVKQIDIVKTIIEMLKKEFDCKAYSDESLEGFVKPCFFIKFMSTSTPQTVNFTSKHVSIVLTYFPKDSERNEVHYLDVFDRVQMLFQIGIQVGGRYLHIDSITEERAGEEQDILQITIELPYLDRVIRPKSTAELMGSVEVKVDMGEGKEETTWQN